MGKSLENTDADFNQIFLLIKEAKNRVYAKANKELVLLYFNVGKVVSEKVNTGNWGDKTVQELADFIASKQPELTGFNRRGLYRMKQFYETYSDPVIVSSVMTQLQIVENRINSVSQTESKKVNKFKKVSTALTQIQHTDNQVLEFLSTVLTKIQWSSHLHILNKTKTTEEKTFYIFLAISQRLTVRELERQLNTSTFERTLLSDKIVSSVSTKLPQNIFRDPYIFEFLTLPDGHSEKDFEKAITLNLQKFILEVGKGFTYMGHQYRLQVGNRDYYTDLLFYHRDLQCLVLFELKIQEFEPEFLGKLNFYLEALDRDVKRPNENASIGILLCKGKDTEVVEYALARNTSPAIIAEYQTKLIDKKLLVEKLHQLAELLNKEIER
ncbi:PDDEXK nuclease domain-containing protein [Lunatibacter salilacus]|uniref:PDDEXK nuclease domain-containing protein n=1 Tax=Lunatibacter salilacus TaxID=2483804 RepID=UPI00131A7F9C|nr:PDDEXK nuclease domain-containing protein [Lunatibacter salilacus]